MFTIKILGATTLWKFVLKNLIRMNSNRFEFSSIFQAEQICFGHNFCIENPNQLILIAKFFKNHALSALKISVYLEKVGCWVFAVFFVLIGSFRFSLGADECVDPVSDPLQLSEQIQQGKQFDHIYSIPLLSSLILCIQLVCMHALFCC